MESDVKTFGDALTVTLNHSIYDNEICICMSFEMSQGDFISRFHINFITKKFFSQLFAIDDEPIDVCVTYLKDTLTHAVISSSASLVNKNTETKIFIPQKYRDELCKWVSDVIIDKYIDPELYKIKN